MAINWISGDLNFECNLGITLWSVLSPSIHFICFSPANKDGPLISISTWEFDSLLYQSICFLLPQFTKCWIFPYCNHEYCEVSRCISVHNRILMHIPGHYYLSLWSGRAYYNGTLFSTGLMPIMLIILSTLGLSLWSKKKLNPIKYFFVLGLYRRWLTMVARI